MLGHDFDETFAARLRDADEFYRDITPETSSADEARVMRQALAGMLWSKQYYFFDLNRWLDEHHGNPLRGEERQQRNREVVSHGQRACDLDARQVGVPLVRRRGIWLSTASP